MIRVAAIQYKPHKLHPQKSREELSALIIQAAKAGAKIIVCPEMAISGYLFANKKSAMPFAEEPEGETFRELSTIAETYHVYIICGYIEKDVLSNNLYNSALVISSQGKLIHSYRKVLLYDSDMYWATSGTEHHLIETEFGTLTVGICMDLNDIHFLMYVADKQPDIIAFCTNWLDEGEEVLPYWKMRLYGYKGVFIAANAWGEDNLYDIDETIQGEHNTDEFDSRISDGRIQFSGKSAILANDRVFAIAKKSGNECLWADIDV